MGIIAGIMTGEGFIPLIPVWFYLLSSMAYGIAALISFLVSYYSYKIFSTDKRLKSNLFLALGFLGLGIAFSVLTFTSVYTYLHDPFLKGFLSLNIVNVKIFNLYYAISLVSYILLNIAYLPKRFVSRLKILPVLF